MSVYLRDKKLTSGKTSLYLDIYLNGKRHYEFLNLYLTKNREQNKEIKSLAESIRSKRELEIKHDQFGLIPSFKIKGNFVSYFEEIKKTRPKSERAWSGAFNHLKDFTKGVIKFYAIDEKWLEDFKKYLMNTLKSQNSAHTYFSKINAALNQAVRDKIILKNPANNVRKIGIKEVEKTYLTLEELEKLAKTKCNKEEVKRAFLFCCFTGLRYSDAKELIWNSVKGDRLEFRQKKTQGYEYFPLSATAKKLIYTQENVMNLPSNKVFNLPVISYTIKTLKNWCKDAGIKKNVSTHTARHTFATLSLTYGVDLFTVSKLLGHKQISQTQVYAKIIDKKKEEAVNSLPVLMIQ